MTFEENVINNTVSKLISGADYREEILNSINANFFDFTISFFKEIVDVKMSSKTLDLEWYKKHFINIDNFEPSEAAIYAGMNKKSITNT